MHREVPSAWILRCDLNPSFSFFPFRVFPFKTGLTERIVGLVYYSADDYFGLPGLYDEE